jgi:hypothetical protein
VLAWETIRETLRASPFTIDDSIVICAPLPVADGSTPFGGGDAFAALAVLPRVAVDRGRVLRLVPDRG